MKNLVLALSAAAVISAAPLQAQAFSSFTANNDGAEFWDNLSADGLGLGSPQTTFNTCNSGFIVTGAAPTACINQRPNTWLPYTGLHATEYWNVSGNWAPIIFSAGDYTLSYLGGTTSQGCSAPCTGGDVAGMNLDWGIFAVGNRSSTISFNSLPTLGSFSPAVSWGIYVDLVGGGRAYSDTDQQFALFGFGRLDPMTWIAGVEDNAAGDFDYQDMMFRITADNGSPPQEVVPEPATMTLLATGLAGMAAAKRRRNRK